MKIKTKIYVFTIMPVLITVLIVIIIHHTNLNTDRLISQTKLADTLIKGVFNLNTLTYEYVHDISKRAKMQWELKHCSITGLLTGLDIKDRKTKLFSDKIFVKLQNHKSLFESLLKSYEKVDINKRDLQIIDEFRGITVSNILISSREIITENDKFVQYLNSKLDKLHMRSNILVISMCITISVGVVIVLVLNGRSLTIALTKLDEGTKIISNGNFDYQIEITRKDEFADLAQTFNKMTLQLKNMILSISESEKKFYDLYENSPDLQISVDHHTKKIIECNSAVAKATGYTKDELIGSDILEIYHPDCLHEATIALNAFVTKGEVSKAELQLKRKDGSKMDVLLDVTSHKDQDGNVEYSRSVWRDITRLKETELELKKAKEAAEAANRAKSLLRQLTGPKAYFYQI